MSKSVLRYPTNNDSGNAGGVLKDTVKWHPLITTIATLRPGETVSVAEDKLEALNDEFFSKIPPLVKHTKDTAKLAVDTLERVIGTADRAEKLFTSAFSTLLSNLGANLPKLVDIQADPENAYVPADPHFQYVVATAIAKNVDAKTVDAYTKYLARLSPDIASMASHDIEKNDPAIMTPELKALQLLGR